MCVAAPSPKVSGSDLIPLFGCFQSYHHFVVFPPRDPPNVVFQRETVAVRAKVGHCDSTLSSNWCEDAPQAISALGHDLLHNAHLSCFILCNR